MIHQPMALSMPIKRCATNMKALYPFKFVPILKSTLWGGKKLGSLLGKSLGNDSLCGESWEISGVDGNVSVLANGYLKGENLKSLINTYKGELLGDKVYENFGDRFPLLIKFIDANLDLSIQVHPNDRLARKRHNSFGKTEMWYVIDAEEGASLISGFNKATSKSEYLEYFNSGQLIDLLNREEVYKDDVYFLPAGRVHTIGKGLLIAEIQQTSDITYRIYDFDRVDKDGNKRELHINEALDAIDFSFHDHYKTEYDRNSDESQLANCNYFITNRLIVKDTIRRDYAALDCFVILMAIEGSGKLLVDKKYYMFNQGETFLIPACLNRVEIITEKNIKLLEVSLP